MVLDGSIKLFYLVDPKENMVWYNIERPFRNLVRVVQNKFKKDK